MVVHEGLDNGLRGGGNAVRRRAAGGRWPPACGVVEMLCDHSLTPAAAQDRRSRSVNAPVQCHRRQSPKCFAAILHDGSVEQHGVNAAGRRAVQAAQVEADGALQSFALLPSDAAGGAAKRWLSRLRTSTKTSVSPSRMIEVNLAHAATPVAFDRNQTVLREMLRRRARNARRCRCGLCRARRQPSQARS